MNIPVDRVHILASSGLEETTVAQWTTDQKVEGSILHLGHDPYQLLRQLGGVVIKSASHLILGSHVRIPSRAFKRCEIILCHLPV